MKSHYITLLLMLAAGIVLTGRSKKADEKPAGNLSAVSGD
jgi:hypothetical protein